MHQSNGAALALASVTVTFNPDLAQLSAQLAALPAEALKVVVDNASRSDTLERVAELVAVTPHALLVRNERNEGLPAALNLGVERAFHSDASRKLVLLLDQDSEPEPGSVITLIQTLRTLEDEYGRVGAVGPRLDDADTGLQHGFHQSTRWRWRRVFPQREDPPVPVANLNGSGTLMPISVFRDLGGLDEAFFIDHVDTEWSFRLASAGYRLFGVPAAVFRHRMGERGVRFWLFGWRVWPARSAQRHYYLFRNAIRLIRRCYVPNVWRSWAVVKLALTALVVTLAGPQRRAQLTHMMRGVRDGLKRGEHHVG